MAPTKTACSLDLCAATQWHPICKQSRLQAKNDTAPPKRDRISTMLPPSKMSRNWQKTIGFRPSRSSRNCARTSFSNRNCEKGYKRSWKSRKTKIVEERFWPNSAKKRSANKNPRIARQIVGKVGPLGGFEKPIVQTSSRSCMQKLKKGFAFQRQTRS